MAWRSPYAPLRAACLACRCGSRRRSQTMGDVVLVLLTIVSYVLLFLLVKGFDRV